MSFNWVCLHCGTPQAVVDEKFRMFTMPIRLAGQVEGELVLQSLAIGCVNQGCEKTSIKVLVGEGLYDGKGYEFVEDVDYLFEQFIIPSAISKPQPDYIPQALRSDYVEACLIRELSPKASATLVRRCLQGMIRDFTGITKGRLVDEIDALRQAVDDGTAPSGVTLDSVEAIDAVRSIGNIGAHMGKDIDVIVDVEEGEAQALIELVEMLFEEWYIARHKRKERLAHIEHVAAVKKLEIKAQTTIATEIGAPEDPE